jgi:hypothetical protein
MRDARQAPQGRVGRMPEILLETHGALPKGSRTDNGPECISNPLHQWCHNHKIETTYIQPSKPTQNAYIERCNRTLREELLNAWAFESLPEVRWFVEKWMYDYNHLRPHNALKSYPPSNISINQLKLRSHSFEWTSFRGSLHRGDVNFCNGRCMATSALPPSYIGGRGGALWLIPKRKTNFISFPYFFSSYL